MENHLGPHPPDTLGLENFRMAMLVLVLSFVFSRALIVLAVVVGSNESVLATLMCQRGICMDPIGTKGLFEALCRWDCGGFIGIWSHGYDTSPNELGEASWAFFPLFPVLISIFTDWHLAAQVEAAIVLNNAFLLGAGWLLYLLAQDRFDHATALLVVVLFFCSPFSLYLSVPLSESVFNLLSVGAFYAAYRGRWLTCGLAAALLSATRPNGVLIGFAILLIAINKVGFRELLRVHVNTRIWLALSLCPLGMCLYAAYLHFLVGDALAFMHVQLAWGREFTWPPNSYTALIEGWEKSTFSGLARTYMVSCGAATLCAAYLLIMRKHVPEGIFLGLIVLVSVGSSILSIPRHVLALWTGYLALALLLQGKPKLTMVVVSLSIALLWVYTVGWVNGLVGFA